MPTLALPPPGIPFKPPNLAPNRTLYIRNLDDKIPKPDLKRNLYMLFASYGIVLDIIALKTLKMRGQAHVVFRDTDASTQAMRALDGFTFFGRDMKIAYAKSKSDTIAKLDGSFTLPIHAAPTELSAAPVQTSAQAAIFGAAPTKAVAANEADRDRAKGVKRGRDEGEEEEEEEEDDAEMQMSESDEE